MNLVFPDGSNRIARFTLAPVALWMTLELAPRRQQIGIGTSYRQNPRYS
jgi:hypothetical protein